MNALQIPPPSNWQDFESLCCDLWRRIWGDLSAYRVGREGQAQAGIDIVGRPERRGDWVGIQCKLRNQLTGGQLTEAVIREAVKKAKDFRPKLGELIIATTALRDAVPQQTARIVTSEEVRAAPLVTEAPFSVSIFAWQDIQEELSAYPHIVAKYYRYSKLEHYSTLETARRLYLRALWDKLYPLRLTGISGGTTERNEIPLAAVYTALDVSVEISVDSKVQDIQERLTEPTAAYTVSNVDLDYLRILLEQVEQEAEDSERWGGFRKTYSRHMKALEVAAAIPHLVLLGPTGSGKSTFGRYLSLNLAGEALDKSDANLQRLNGLSQVKDSGFRSWPHGLLLPIFVSLKRFVASALFPTGNKEGNADHLIAYLETIAPRIAQPSFSEFLRNTLANDGRGTILVLDGFDEIQEQVENRGKLCEIISSFTRSFFECRLILTSRPYAYKEEELGKLNEVGFQTVTLAPFDTPKIRSFIAGWYRSLAERGQIDLEVTNFRIQNLWKKIKSTPHLEPLARRPLMLTMMADLHATSGGRLPGGRAALMEQSIGLLLDRWNSLRETQSTLESLGMTAKQIRKALEDLAYHVHRKSGLDNDDPGTSALERTAKFGPTELLLSLGNRRDPPEQRQVDERQVMNYLHQRSGILIEEKAGVYRFPLRSYQEYLAACYFTGRNDFPRNLIQEVESDPDLWREVLLLAAGKSSEFPAMAWALLDGLVPWEPEEETTADDPRFKAVLLAGQAILENKLWSDVQSPDDRKLERIGHWLEQLLICGALSPADRTEAGRILGSLGDYRQGISLSAGGAPNIDWVGIPGGVPLERELQIQPFSIGRYPVTNLQFSAFVEDGGYTKKWRSCWTEAGWKWKGSRLEPYDDLPEDYLLTNHPRVNLTWFEAYAFCLWLGKKLDHRVFLPTEKEWETTARGIVSTGELLSTRFDSNACNVRETKIGRTCACGCFPEGASCYGVQDMVGNVWEWCSTHWRASQGEPADDNPESENSRVLRGGSFSTYYRDVRHGARLRRDPVLADVDIGFRVAADPIDPA